MEKKKLSLDLLIPWSKNPRKITAGRLQDLKNSIERNPQLIEKRPLLVTVRDGQYIVYGGNQRLKAMKLLGWKEADVIIDEDISDEKMIEEAMVDNVNFGELVLSMAKELDLSNEMQEILRLDLSDIKISAPDDVPEIIETNIKKGDLFQLGEHRLLCGDSTNKEELDILMNGEKAEMVFTDPPYNVDYQGGMHADGSQTKRRKILNDKMSSENFYCFLLAVMKNLISVTNGAFYVAMSSSELHNLHKAFTDGGGALANIYYLG